MVQSLGVVAQQRVLANRYIGSWGVGRVAAVFNGICTSRDLGRSGARHDDAERFRSGGAVLAFSIHTLRG